MTLTGTTHPPGGAAAVLAVVDSTARDLGWRFVGLIAVGMGVMIAMAALLGNGVGRRYPVWWWSERATGSFWVELLSRGREVDLEAGQAVEIETVVTSSWLEKMDESDVLRSNSEKSISLSANSVY
jgi:CBS-domain-containing membrane protein